MWIDTMFDMYQVYEINDDWFTTTTQSYANYLQYLHMYFKKPKMEYNMLNPKFLNPNKTIIYYNLQVYKCYSVTEA